MNNSVYGDNYGNVGGYNNIVINIFIQGNRSFIQRTELPETTWALIILDVFNECSDLIVDQIEQGIKQRDGVIKVDMTDVYDYCTRLLYHNGIKSDDVIEDFVARFFSTLVIMNSWNFDVEIVHFRMRTFFELTYPN